MSNHSKQILIGNFKKTVMFCARHFFCSQVFKTTSNVLNSDVNIVNNIALIAFCSLAVTNLAHWATSSLRRWNAIYQNPVKAKTNYNCVTNYRPASDPHESKGGEIRYKILRFAQHWFVSLLALGRCFAFFTLRDQLVRRQKCSLILWCRLREVIAKSRAQVYFGFVPRLSSNLQLVTQQIC